MKNIWLNDKVLTGMSEQSEILESLLNNRTNLIEYLKVINFAILKEVLDYSTEYITYRALKVDDIADDLIASPKEVDLFALAVYRILDKVKLESNSK